MRIYIVTSLLSIGLGLALSLPVVAQQGYGGNGYGGGFGGGYGGGFGGGYGGGYGQGYGGYGGMSGAFAPNFYNPQTQPLSPYLNLLRGGNTAVNYYYGARPGLPAGGFMMPYGISPGAMVSNNYFTKIDSLFDEEEKTAPKGGMPPTGHAFGFNNQLGYFGTGGGLRNRGGQGGQSPIQRTR